MHRFKFFLFLNRNLKMEFWSLLSVWWFLFFLLIIAIWYFFVEVVCGDKYFLRKQLKKYNNNLFDRILHYISWWVIIDAVYIYISLLNKNSYKEIVNLFNYLDKVSNIIYAPNALAIQLFLFWIYIFLSILIGLLLCLGCVKILEKLNLRISKKKSK